MQSRKRTTPLPPTLPQLEALSSSLLSAEERAIDSGVVDDAFPLSPGAREAQQLELARWVG